LFSLATQLWVESISVFESQKLIVLPVFLKSSIVHVCRKLTSPNGLCTESVAIILLKMSVLDMPGSYLPAEFE